MSDQREVFTIVEDKDTAGLGVALKGKTKGDAVADVQMPVFPCEDTNGNEAKIPLTADNRVSVSLDGAGTPRRDSAAATPGALLTDTDVATVTLVAGELYQLRAAIGSSLQPVLYTVVHEDDGTPDEICRFLTGSGDFNFDHSAQQAWEFTAGATGTQELKIIAQQLRGPLSDVHGSLSCLELSN